MATPHVGEVGVRHRLDRAVADLAQRTAPSDDLAGVGDGVVAQCGFAGEPVDKTHRQALRRDDVGAGEHHLQRPARPGDTGQPLGAAGPGEQTEVDLGQPTSGRGYGDAVVGAQGNLQPASQGGAVDRGDHRLG